MNKIISLGNNCFWGLITKSIAMQTNQLDFFIRTSFLYNGILSRNNVPCSKIKILNDFLKMLIKADFSWLNKSRVSYRGQKKYINYYIYGQKNMPLFYKHIDGNFIENEMFFTTNVNFAQYAYFPADIYIYAIPFEVKNDDIEYLVEILKLLRSLNENCKFICFVDETRNFNLKIDEIEVVPIDLKDCYMGENIDLKVEKPVYDKICNSLHFNLNKDLFLY